MNQIVLRTFIVAYTIAIEIIRYCVIPVIQVKNRSKNLDGRRRAMGPEGDSPASDISTVWLHGASLGEAKLLHSFLEVLRKKHPDDRYVLTAATSSGVGYLADLRGGDVVAVGFLPYDTPGLMRRLLQRFRVHRVWIMETEIWPSMLFACLQAGVRTGIVNGRLEPASYRWYRRLGILIKPLFAQFDLVLAQTEDYARRFVDTGVPADRVRITGNLKSRVSIILPDAFKRTAIRARFGIGPREPVVTAGCVHPGEARTIASAMAVVRRSMPLCRCIVVPRHIEKSRLIAQESDDAIHINEPSTAENWATCVVAKYGVLDELYGIADVAVVGGTFVDVGGHNMWDAARHGVPVVFGPDYSTQQESAEMLLSSGVGFTAPDGDGLARIILELFGDRRRKFEEDRDRFSHAIAATQPDLETLIP